MAKMLYFLIWILKKVLKKETLKVIPLLFFFFKSLNGSISADPW